MRDLYEFSKDGDVYLIPSLNAVTQLWDVGQVYDVLERAGLKTAGQRRQAFIAKAQDRITLRMRFDMFALTEEEVRELIESLQQSLSQRAELTA